MTIDELTPTELMKRLLERHFASFYSRFAYWLFVPWGAFITAPWFSWAKIDWDVGFFVTFIVVPILIALTVATKIPAAKPVFRRRVDFDPDKYIKQVAVLAGLLSLYCLIAENISMTSLFTYHCIFVVSTFLPQFLFHRQLLHKPIKPVSFGEGKRKPGFPRWFDCVLLVLCIPVYAGLFAGIFADLIGWLSFWGTFWFFCVVFTPRFGRDTRQRWREG